MAERQTHAVTGAFGYSGKYIARRLLDKGHRVVTLTNSPDRPDPFGGEVPAIAYNFDRPARLTESLRGVDVLYNTYWVRFNNPAFTHNEAVENTRILFNAAKEAGVKRFVHVSITNPSLDSPLEYFSGKAQLEDALRQTGMSHAILRPAVLFGREDILINNIAWALRRFPVFGIFGDGSYRLQPIYVDDLAALAVEQGEKQEDVTIDATGPETFTYRALVETIRTIIGARCLVVGIPPALGYWASKAIGCLVRDTFITREEIKGLMAGLLCTHSPPTGTTPLTQWARDHADELGRRYASELGRRRDRTCDYTPGE